MNPWFDIILG